MIWVVATTVAWAGAASETWAEGPTLTVQADAEERARAELMDDGSFDGDLGGNVLIGNRVRAGIRLDIGERVGVYAQVQDVRAWGSEFHPVTGGEGSLFDFAAGGFDLHQGFGELKPIQGMRLRIGRQEINWHGQRLIGAVGWTHQGRSFDALRLQWDHQRYGFEIFYSLLLDRPNPIQLLPRSDDVHLLALRGGPRLGDVLALDVLVITRFDVALDEQLVTTGAHAQGKSSVFRYEAEAYFQGGNRGPASVSAFLVGVRGGVSLGDPKRGGDVLAGVDVVSGDGDPIDAAVHAFDTLYATNHKFYGHLDLYLALPVHTAGRGLIDALVSGAVRPADGLKIGLDAHAFFAAAGNADGYHGFELDLNASWKPLRGFSLAGGLWLYVPGGFWPVSDGPELGAYLQTAFKLGPAQ
jgi:hypothetical protein